MMVTLLEEKMAETILLTDHWTSKQHANIHELRALLRKLLHMMQCCPPVRYCVNHMLATLRDCPIIGQVQFMQEFQKD